MISTRTPKEETSKTNGAESIADDTLFAVFVSRLSLHFFCKFQWNVITNTFFEVRFNPHHCLSAKAALLSPRLLLLFPLMQQFLFRQCFSFFVLHSTLSFIYRRLLSIEWQIQRSPQNREDETGMIVERFLLPLS